MECPLGGQCLQESLIYQATVTNTTDNTEETYIGCTGNSFKQRFRNHKTAFENENSPQKTKLSKHIWTLKSNNKQFTVKWKKIAKAKSYTPQSKQCNLCSREQFYIMYRKHMCTLNDRNELLSKCRHRNKYLFKSQ